METAEQILLRGSILVLDLYFFFAYISNRLPKESADQSSVSQLSEFLEDVNSPLWSGFVVGLFLNLATSEFYHLQKPNLLAVPAQNALKLVI